MRYVSIRPLVVEAAALEMRLVDSGALQGFDLEEVVETRNARWDFLGWAMYQVMASLRHADSVSENVKCDDRGILARVSKTCFRGIIHGCGDLWSENESGSVDEPTWKAWARSMRAEILERLLRDGEHKGRWVERGDQGIRNAGMGLCRVCGVHSNRLAAVEIGLLVVKTYVECDGFLHDHAWGRNPCIDLRRSGSRRDSAAATGGGDERTVPRDSQIWYHAFAAMIV